MKSHFHIKGWATRLALRKRLKVIRKWPILGRNLVAMDKLCMCLYDQQLHNRQACLANQFQRKQLDKFTYTLHSFERQLELLFGSQRVPGLDFAWVIAVIKEQSVVSLYLIYAICKRS